MNWFIFILLPEEELNKVTSLCSTYDILIHRNVFIFFNVLAQSINISYHSCVDSGNVISVSWMEVSALGTASPSKNAKWFIHPRSLS